MDFVRDEFLACAGLSLDKNRRVRRCNHLDSLHQNPIRTTTADDLVCASRIASHHVDKLTRENPILNGVEQLVRIDWLRQEIEGASLDRLDRNRYVPTAR